MNFLTELREGLWISWDAIRAHKLRSTLTTLGIIIGVVTVTLMGTVIEGVNQAFLNTISFLGADTLYVSRNSWVDESEEDWTRSQRRMRITMDQARLVAEQMTTARAVAPTADTMVPVSYKNRGSDSVNFVHVVGTTEQFMFTAGFAVAEGRFLSAEECQGGRPVCVIGQKVATNLFANEPAVGNRLRAGGHTLEVVGVLEPQGGLIGVFLDNQIVVPLRLFSAAFRYQPGVEIQVKAGSVATVETTREELHGLMRRVRRLPPGAPDDFAINSQESILNVWNRVAGSIAAVGMFVTGLSLFVGGIGIMNIMFVSVAERTKEIGIRKAIGAKRRTILIQFLAEAASICLLGGLIALAIGWPLTLLLGKFMPATLSPLVVSIALLVSLLTGVVSGFLPAWRAARMNPVDALRSE
jgi:putative ABC transport system permease protein